MERIREAKKIEVVTRGPSGRIKSSRFIEEKKPETAGRNAALGLTAVLAAGGLGLWIGNNNNSSEAPTGQEAGTTSTILPEGGISTTLPDATTSSTVPETTTTTEGLATTTTTEGQSVQENQGTNNPTQTVEAIFTAEGALAYPDIMNPDPLREPLFPNVPKGERPALAAYESPFEDGDYFEDAHGDVDLPQYYFRTMTAGEIKIDELGIDCKATDERGCLVILVHNFGETAMFRDSIVDNGHTDAGRIFDMSTPEQVTEVGQALLDHKIGRMTESEDGANCRIIGACKEVEWHVVVVGNGEAQAHWTGIYERPQVNS